MKSIVRWILSLTCVAAFAAISSFAGTIAIQGSTGMGWQAFANPTPYWNNASWDGNPPGNIGTLLTSGAGGPYYGQNWPGGPGQLPYWGQPGGAFDTSFYFNSPQENFATVQISIAGNLGSNVLGYYDKGNSNATVDLFTGATQGAVASFTPLGAFGFYLKTASNGTFYTEASLGNDTDFQHFAVFKQSDQKMWIGAEDLAGGGDKDYQDIVFTLSVPEPSLIILLGIGLGAVSLIGWRFKA